MTSDVLNDLISVIVPVYKVEPYLDRCIQSIVDQTYRNLEIILVDDGSPDNCPTMCDAWAEKDDRIKVIHKPNGGLSDARNAGISAATGEYIAFVDSDDWIASETYEKLLACMISTDSDIVSCDALRVWENDTPSRRMIRDHGEYVLNRIDAMKGLIQSTCLIQTVWNKLYKASLVRTIPFEKGKIHEDEFWSWQVIALASRVATIEEACYYYNQRSDSIMGRGNSGSPLLVVEAKLKRHEFITKEMPELKDLDSEDILFTCFYQGIKVLKYDTEGFRETHMKQLKKATSVCGLSKEYLAGRKPANRLKLFLLKHHFKFVCMLAVVCGIE